MNAKEHLALAEIARRIENIVRIGTVAEADYDAARVRVQSGDILTDWVPWLTHRAGGDVAWWPPEVGEQVLLLSPSGDMALAVAALSIYQAQHPAPEAVATKRRINFGDGSWVEYDRAAHKLTATVNGGDAELNATGSIDAVAGGDASITAGGNVTADGAQVILNGGGSGGVVCQQHVCAFTGSPHPQGSAEVSAGG